MVICSLPLPPAPAVVPCTASPPHPWQQPAAQPTSHSELLSHAPSCCVPLPVMPCGLQPEIPRALLPAGTQRLTRITQTRITHTRNVWRQAGPCLHDEQAKQHDAGDSCVCGMHNATQAEPCLRPTPFTVSLSYTRPGSPTACCI